MHLSRDLEFYFPAMRRSERCYGDTYVRKSTIRAPGTIYRRRFKGQRRHDESRRDLARLRARGQTMRSLNL